MYQGISPKEYLESLRLTRAKFLLKENKLTILQISDSLGFNDYSSFFRWFRNSTGRTPRKYRMEKLKKKQQKEEQTPKSSDMAQPVLDEKNINK